METPSSARRVTRSQALASANSTNNIPMSKIIQESEKKVVAKSGQKTGKQQDRSALIDITNDSPIVGLASGDSETPLSSLSKRRINNFARNCLTPGSGEALLRGQVKTLLQKVEEEAVISKISFERRHFVQGISPMALLAPTPANTPLMDLSGIDMSSVTQSPIDDKFVISQMINEMIEGKKKQESLESEKSYITRSLLLDFSEKSEGSESSVLMNNNTTADEDNESVWSIQVNASTKDEEDDEIELDEGLEEEEEFDENCDENEEEYEQGLLVDDLCDAINKIDVNGGVGKHTRFVYNSSDDECQVSPGVLHLKGLPTPKGKHLRFPEEN